MFAGRYELGDTLGSSALSDVYLARDVRLGRRVVVKVMREDLADDPELRSRFLRERSNTLELNHTGIVMVYDAGETRTRNGNRPYLVREYVDGRTLRDILAAEGPLPEHRAFGIAASVCDALSVVHAHGLVHCGLCPAEILVTAQGTAKLIGFDLARSPREFAPSDGGVIGVVAYMAPEQARGDKVDGRSDLYALGCVLFEMLTGRTVFVGDSPVAIAYQHVREDPLIPSALRSQLTEAADRIVLTALAKNPADRYRSAAEMGDELAVRPSRPQARTTAPARSPRAGFIRTANPASPTQRPKIDRSAFPASQPIRLKNPRLLKMTPLDRREQPHGESVFVFDNSKSSSTHLETINLSHVARFEIAVHADKSRTVGGAAGVKFLDLVNVEGRLERQILDKHIFGAQRELTFSQTTEINIPASTHVRVRFIWILIWEEGVITVGNGTDPVADIPYSVTVGLRFDKVTEDVH